MPFSRLRPNRPSDAALRRHSTLDPANIPGDARDSQDVANNDPSNTVRSSSPLRKSIDPAGAANDASFGERTLRAPSPNPRQQRFSILKFRHASDSQLAKTAKEQAAASTPPMPSTPSIITTGPSGDAMPPPKKKSTFTLPRRQKIPDLTRSLTSKSSRASLADKIQRPQHGASVSANQSARASRLTFDEPERHRGSQAPPAYGDHANSALALPVTRLSESSRSDGSGDHGVYATTTTTHTVSTTTTFFRLPRRKKTKGPLFPLPVKIPPPESRFPPSLGTSSPERHSAHDFPRGQSPTRAPVTALHRPRPDTDQSSGVPSPTTPSINQLDGPALNFNPPSRSSSPRHSTNVSTSGRSSPIQAHPARPTKKGRSSTKGSLRGLDDESMPTPTLPASGRNSSSTTGRSSLGGFLNLSRLRQNSEPQTARSGSSYPPLPGTPISAGSKSHSFSLVREPFIVPERHEGDTPPKYLSRLQEAVSRGAVAVILSKSDDDFSKNVLRSYMRGFKFFGDPMDMAIRKLLMEVELPKETQQIDRVLQSFANRYHECNPGVFASPDEAYFIAFSILILHTDVFNKNNKHKMQRPDYCKNARGQGVAEEILECFYDNISYTPFIHVEDDIDINGERVVPKPKRSMFSRTSTDSMGRGSREPVDPYTLILDNRLDSLRPSLKDVMNLDDPYSYLGTAPSLDLSELHDSFFKSGILQIVSSRSRPDAFMSPETMANPAEAHPGVVDIKVTKVGVLWRKDMKKKKARSPWQEWGAILTGAQLYFFRNTTWIKSLMHQQEAHKKEGLGSAPVTFNPPLEHFKPDVMMSTEDAVGLVDATYKKHKHAFLFVRHGGFEEIFLADNENDMNDWLAKLNYASAFKTAGVRMRGVIGNNYDGQRPRGVRRMDSSTSTQSVKTASGQANIRNGKIDEELAQQIQTARRQIMAQRILEAEEQLATTNKQLDARLRNGRHLQVLAPIQNKTREQIILAAGATAAKVKWLRLEMWRTRCHKDVLALDLEEELRSTGTPDIRKERSPASDSTTSKSHDLHGVHPVNPQTNPRNDNNRPSTQPASRASFTMDDAFRSPNQASPTSVRKTRGSWELPPLSFDQTKSPKKSGAGNDATTTAQQALTHRISQGSVRGSDRVPSLAEMATRLATPAPSVDDDEQAVLKEAGVFLPDSPSSKAKRPGTASSGENDQDRDNVKATDVNVAEGRPKIRRSLQRTLRDSHHSGNHHRSKKGKDSASSAAATEDAASLADSEGLARGTGSFTVHGKKASVITFGAEWQDMTPEERIKLRRSAHADDHKLAVPLAVDDESLSMRSASMSDLRRVSAVSDGTTTTKSTGVEVFQEDRKDPPRTMSSDVGPDEIRRSIQPSLAKDAPSVDLDGQPAAG